MAQLQLFNPGALKPFIKCLTLRNIDAAHYLERQLIPPECVAWGTGQILKQQVYRFFDDVVQREGINGLGFLAGDPFPITELGPLGSCLGQAVTLHDAINTFAQMLPTVVEGNSIRLVKGNTTSWLCCLTAGLPRTASIADHTSILTLREVIRLAAGTSWQPGHIKLYTESTPVADSLPELVMCNLEFQQDYTAISFPTNFLHKPLQHKRDELYPSKKNQYSDSLPTTTLGKLHTFLTTLQNYHQLPTINEVAEILGMTRITLFRLLSKEKTNYRQIVERVRFNFAISLLEDPQNSIKAISYALGYSHPGNFSRAFLRMSGVSPCDFRKNLVTKVDWQV